MPTYRKGSCLFCDIVFMVLAALYAWAVNIGIEDISAGGAVIDSDLATYAQAMAGAAWPSAFTADPVLHAMTPGNSIWNLQRFLAEHIGSPDNPALALLRVGALTVFFHLVSFYILGRWLFGRPSLAALTSLLMAITVYMEWGTFWGVLQSDPVPRVLYGALWPFLLMGCLVALQRAWLRPLVMLATGASMWVHGVNALNCGAMFFLAFFLCRPAYLTWSRHLLLCLCCLVLYFIPVLAFLWPSLAPKAFSADDLALFREVFTIRWEKDYGHVAERLMHLVSFDHHSSILGIVVVGFIGWVFVLLRGQGRILDLAKICPPFLLALLCVVGFSTAESIWSQANGRLPLGHELVRGLRYLIPLSWLMLVGLIASTGLPAKKILHVRPFSILVLATAITLLCIVQDRQNIAALAGINKVTGIVMPHAAKAQEQKLQALAYKDLIVAISQYVPDGEAVFSDGEDMAVRYLAKRPLVHTFKDGYAHYYSRDVAGCRTWLMYAQKMKNALEHPEEIVNTWLASGAPWLVLHKHDLLVSAQQYGELVWEGQAGALLKRLKQ